MNHIGLYYFTVAAEELNITRAAAKLFISQQSLSEHIRKLEKQYDAVFFTRGGRLALTSQGERMLRYAREVLEADRDLHVALRDAGEANRIRLRIGVTSNRASVFFPAILARYRKRCPNVVPSILSGNYEYIEQQYRLENIELYSGMSSNIRTHTPAEMLYRDKLYFIVSRALLNETLGPDGAAEFLRAHADGITMPEACRFPIVLPPPTSTLRLSFERGFSKNALHPDVVLETSDHDILYELCRTGVSGCFASRELLYGKLVHAAPDDGVLLFPLQEFEELSGFCLIYRKEGLSPEAAALIDCARDAVAETVGTIDRALAARCRAQLSE